MAMGRGNRLFALSCEFCEHSSLVYSKVINLLCNFMINYNSTLLICLIAINLLCNFMIEDNFTCIFESPDSSFVLSRCLY